MASNLSPKGHSEPGPVRGPVRLIATFFFIGYIPVAPGTAGSLAGLLLYFAFPEQGPLLAAVLALLGLGVCHSSVRAFADSDPKVFVLDEVSGMMISLLWLPQSFFTFVTAFALFRLLDVLKPWPVSIFQKMKSPFGIMLDDLAAGLIANLALRAVALFF